MSKLDIKKPLGIAPNARAYGTGFMHSSEKISRVILTCSVESANSGNFTQIAEVCHRVSPPWHET